MFSLRRFEFSSWKKIALKKNYHLQSTEEENKHECFLCKKKVDRGSYHCGIILPLKP